MSVQRRKDSKGRVLKTGESERKDGTYMYRYSDAGGTRRSVYAPDLKALREKEEEIEKDFRDGLKYTKAEITIAELLETMLSLKCSLSLSTRTNYSSALTYLKKFSFLNTPIKHVKTASAKSFILEIAPGHKFSTISRYKAILRSAFKMACEDDILLRNPFDFSLKDLLQNDAEQKSALSFEQTKAFFNFVHARKSYSKYEDDFRILLGTGLRISEFCGLTIDDIDFEHRRIHVNHQLNYQSVNHHNEWLIRKPKTKSGNRFVPMSDEVYQCLQNELKNRRHLDSEPIVDGYTNFVFLSKSKNGSLLCENRFIQTLHHLEKSYQKENPNGPELPHLTPHLFRHTFCTNAINSGMNIKTVQYIMGHSDVGTTLRIYTHTSQEIAFHDFYKIMNTQSTQNDAPLCAIE